MKSLKLSRTATMPYAMGHLACDLRPHQWRVGEADRQSAMRERLAARSYWLVLLLLFGSTLVLRDR